MKAVLLKGDGVVAVETVPIPVPQPGEALIRVLRAGICNTDIELIKVVPMSCTAIR